METEDKILRRLEEIEESINLGTLDTTIFGLMIFVFATMLSLISFGIPNLIVKSPYLVMGFLFFIMFTMPLVQYIFAYVQTIFFKEKRFTLKKRIITFLSGEIIFVVLMWGFLFVAWIYERWWPIPVYLIYIIFFGLLIVSILITSFYIKPKVNKYFDENFKTLLARRDLEIKKAENLP